VRLRLATRISATIVGVLLLALLCSVVGLFAAQRFSAALHTIVDENLASVRAAEELEIALLEQRGYVSSYVLDNGNRAWLNELQAKQATFAYWLIQARHAAHTPAEHRILSQLEDIHHDYDRKRDEVVVLYDSGHVDAAKSILLKDVTALYLLAYQQCESFLAANNQYANAANERVRREVARIRWTIGTCVVVTVGLGVALLWLFFHGVIFPLRHMAADARHFASNGKGVSIDDGHDEMRTVGLYLHSLMENVAETRWHLERSQSQLLQAEKLASVGKLAASVAHEIRNPLTSLKLWLYSIRKAVGDDPSLRRPFEMVSDETTRLESIVRNFLEFSRPPGLKLSPQNVAILIDKTLELLRLRLAERGIEPIPCVAPDLPDVLVDQEQIRQVLINLLDNSVDAMPRGGRVRICADATVQSERRFVVVRIEDAGGGIPRDVQERIFEPFFTTKEHGTGLGLCIAASVMARHEGSLVLDMSSSAGTTFAVWIPALGD